MRVTELVMAFPALILVMVVAFSLGPSFWSDVVALAVAWTPSFVRLTRNTVIQIRAQTFVEATRALGASSRHLILRTVLPHAFPALLPKATTNIGMVVIVSAGLSYVGLGVRPPTPDWGNMIADSTQYVFQGWWLGFFPASPFF